MRADRGSQERTGQQRWAGGQCRLLGLLPRTSVGKEEALCRLQEENQRLSREQERVSRVDRQGAGGVPAVSGKSSQGPSCWAHCSSWEAWKGTGPRMVVICGETGRGQGQGSGRWHSARTARAPGTEPTFLCGLSWQKSWSWSYSANSVWRVNGGRPRATGRPRLLTS